MSKSPKLSLKEKFQIFKSAGKSLAKGGSDDISFCFGEHDDPQHLRQNPKHCFHGASMQEIYQTLFNKESLPSTIGGIVIILLGMAGLIGGGVARHLTSTTNPYGAAKWVILQILGFLLLTIGIAMMIYKVFNKK